MTDTYHNKSLYVNSSTTSLTDSSDFKAETPVFFYKDLANLNWQINDSTGTGVDLTGGTFTFNIAESYNTAVLVSVADGSFTKTGIATGSISCLFDTDDADVLAYIDSSASKTIQCALWMTLSGADYCLVAFSATLKNIVT